MTSDQAQAILARLDAQAELLERIDRQVQKTNGRVTKLELWQARTEGARAVFSWVSPAVAGIVSALVVALIVAVLTGTTP